MIPRAGATSRYRIADKFGDQMAPTPCADLRRAAAIALAGLPPFAFR